MSLGGEDRFKLGFIPPWKRGVCGNLSVRPELVEGLFFSSAASKEEGQPFDKLRANG